MSRSNNRGLELKLSLSRARGNGRPVAESPETSPAKSCVSTEDSLKDSSSYCSSPETTSASMVVVGCPRCLVYIMLSEVDPTCPNCRSTALLHFLHRDVCNNLPENTA